MNRMHLPLYVGVVDVLWYCCLYSKYMYMTYQNKNKTTIKNKVIREKTEQKDMHLSRR